MKLTSDDFWPRRASRQRGRSAGLVAAAFLVFMGCGVITVSAWNGQHTDTMPPTEARRLLDDAGTPPNQRLLLETQLFREGERILHTLTELAKRDDAVGRAAKAHLEKLKR